VYPFIFKINFVKRSKFTADEVLSERPTWIDPSSLGLRYCRRKQPFRHLRSQHGTGDISATCFAENGDSGRVSTKGLNVLWDPLKCSDDIVVRKGSIVNSIIENKEPQVSQSAIGGFTYYITARCEISAVRVGIYA
jgi:hypothetical protein